MKKRTCNMYGRMAFAFLFIVSSILFSCSHDNSNDDSEERTTDKSTINIQEGADVKKTEILDIKDFKEKYLLRVGSYDNYLDDIFFYTTTINTLGYGYYLFEEKSFIDHDENCKNGDPIQYGKNKTVDCLYKDINGTSVVLYDFHKDSTQFRTKNGGLGNSMGPKKLDEDEEFIKYICTCHAFRVEKYNDEYIILRSGSYIDETNETESITDVENINWDRHSYVCKISDIYRISFDANGGNIATQNQECVKEVFSNIVSAESLGLTREGYTFIGWAKRADSKQVEYKDTEKAYFNEDVTLYAVWASDVSYNIYFKPRADSTEFDTKILTGKSTTSEISGKVPYSYCSLSGYVFEGWSTLPSKIDEEIVSGPYSTEVEYKSYSDITISSDITLYAVWSKAESYEIAFDANGGKIVNGTQTSSKKNVILGNEIGEIECTLNKASTVKISRTGYRFRGWAKTATATDVEFEDGSKFTLDSNIILYALWDKEISYTVTFNPNGGTIQNKTQTFTGTELTGVTGTLKIQSELNIYKEYGETEYGYTSYVFVGWATSSSATTKKFSDGESIELTGDTTLYAVWSLPAYTVSFTNAAISIPSYRVTGSGGTIYLPDPGTKRGYTFAGWKYGKYLYSENSPIDVVGNYTFTAEWTENCFWVRLYHPGFPAKTGEKFSGLAIQIIPDLTDGSGTLQSWAITPRNGSYNTSYLKISGTSGDYIWSTAFVSQKGTTATTINKRGDDYFKIGNHYTIDVTTGFITVD